MTPGRKRKGERDFLSYKNLQKKMSRQIIILVVKLFSYKKCLHIFNRIQALLDQMELEVQKCRNFM